MKTKLNLGKTGGYLWQHRGRAIFIVVVMILFFACPSLATMKTELLGKPLTVSGFINQGVGYGITGDHFDTQEEWQSFKYDVLLETLYEPNPSFRIFVSGMLSGDWAYDILGDESDWKEKGFDKSRDELSVDTDFRDLLQEAHVTWLLGNFVIRLGKQIVVWGETDSIRLMDQINPLDQRRGITDVEFESTVVPIWLTKLEYFFEPNSSWLQDLGVEFIFNPNADFVANRGPGLGNDEHGIWGVKANGPPLALDPAFGPIPYNIYLGMSSVPVPGLTLGLPPTASSMGSMDADIKDPTDWDSDYFEFGIRLKAVINDAILTLNYYYGREKTPITKFTNPVMAPFSGLDISPYDGRAVLHMDLDGYYPRFRFAGVTFTRDFENLNISALGGVAPVLRLEGFYAFDNTFAAIMGGFQTTFETHDEIRYAIGVDWKIKVNWLNPRAYFTISPQFYHRRIMDYPSGYGLTSTTGSVDQDNYQTTLMVKTSYFHNKLEPMVVWTADHTYDGGFNILQLKYEHSDVWNYTLGAVLIYGRKTGLGFDALENKDHIYFTIGYRF